jgi:FAD/FMN-containing dehydrogenase
MRRPTDARALPPALLDALREAVGSSQVLTDLDLRSGYQTDWTRRFHGESVAVVRPGTTDEVAGVLRACSHGGAAVIPQGGNTGLVGGSVPRAADPDGRPQVVLSLLRLRDEEQVDLLAGEMTVGAGVTLSSVQQRAAAAGWAFGVDMGSRDSATVGGMVATNAGGVNVLRYGSTRQQVVGIEAVLADGTVLRRLPGLIKDNSGYHLPSLLAGSEGTLAVVTRIRLRLVASLPRRVVALLAAGSMADAAALAAALRRALASLTALEAFDDQGLEVVMRHTHAERPFADVYPVYLLVECAAAAADPEPELVGVLGTLPALDAVVAADEGARRRLWQLRERHTEAINALAVPHKLDVSVPLGRLGEFDERVRGAVRAVDRDARTFVYGHLGDGNLHVNVIGPDPDDEAVDDAVLQLVLQLGGAVSAEHGIGVAKTRWLVADRGEADVAAMRAIKRALDPDEVLNPGVVLPPKDG